MTNLEIISESFQGLLAQACLSALLAMVGLGMSARADTQCRDFVPIRRGKDSEAGIKRE